MHKPSLVAWTLMLLSGLAAGVGNLMMKRAHVGSLANLLSPWFLGAMVFYLINVFLLAKALEDNPVSMAAPIVSGANFMVVVLGAALVFGESLNPWQYAGLGAILLGIFLVGR
jgi:multidrug transporter EmrE-like cation transporter